MMNIRIKSNNVMKSVVVTTLIILITDNLFGQAVGLNQQQLVDKVKADMVEKITGELTSAIQSGEQNLANSSFYYDLLKPYEAFGINPNNPNMINSLMDIHSTIKTNMENDPSSTYRSQMSGEIKGLLQTGLTNYATSFIDQGSQDIISGLQDLYAKGQQQISNIAAATERIGNIAEDSPNIDLEITNILTEYGLESDYFYMIDDLEHNFKLIQGKFAEPYKAYTMVSKAMGSKDPAYKIQMLFEIGETFSGKVPILGPLLEPMFTLAKGVLSAARGLENVLEKNLNQGCIDPGGGTYAVVNPSGEVANKRGQFIKQFPHVERACPINMEVYSPVYNNIYFDLKTDALFFYIKNKWQAGKVDAKHNGTQDIKKMVTWLRGRGKIKEATSLDFIFKSYQKEYGIIEYHKQIDRKIREINKYLQPTFQSIDHCDKDKLEKFFMRTIDLNWIDKLLRSGDTGGFSFNEISTFSIRYNDIINQMIHNYYIRNGRDNLRHLDNIIGNLKKKTPIEVRGYVEDDSGSRMDNVDIEISGASIQGFGSDCKQTTTNSLGKYNFYILLPINSSSSYTLTAKPDKGESGNETVTITPEEKRYWTVNFFLEKEKEECGKNEEWSESQERCVCKEGYEEDESGNCVKKEEEHDCKENEVWSDEVEDCVCKDGYTANRDGTCIKIKDCKENEHWDADVGDCVCDDGYERDDQNTCVKKEEDGVIDDCSLDYIKSLVFLLEVLVADTKLKETELINNINKFNKEVNDQSSDVCNNQTVNNCYATAKRLSQEITENITDIQDITVEILMLEAICPDLNTEMGAAGITVKSLISSIAGVGSASYTGKIDQMASRLDENGCDKEESEDDGEKVVPPDDNPGFGGDGGWWTEIPGDGDDNDGDGQQDEEVEDVTGKNIALVLYDSGSAKDDVFSLSVSGYGNLGQTPAGGKKYYRLNLQPGNTYTATIYVVSAPDNVGTYTLSVYYRGELFDGISGSPGQGGSAILTFTVPSE